MFFVFLLVWRLDRHHRPVMKHKRRRKRKNKAGPTRPLMKRGARRRRRRKSPKRRAKNTRRNTEKVRRRNQRRGNKNHHRPPPVPPRPAPVNRQTATETQRWPRAQGIPPIILYSMRAVVCRHCGNMAADLVRHKCHLQEQRFTKATQLQDLTPR